MATLTVGSGSGNYATLAAALSAASNGDTIQVPAGVYTNQYATVTKNVTITGIGGTAYFASTQAVPNGKGILVVHAPGDVTLANLAFTGATTSNYNGANAAGIRYESGNLTLLNDSLFGNQNGMLATPVTNGTGSITIENSTVTNNGVSNPALTKGYGRTHNLYVNHVANLTITGSAITQANVGHEIKSRALSTTVRNSLVAEGPTGTASYSIDLPNAGSATVSGNTIQQGPASQNPAIISNGEEGNLQTGSLSVTGNTIVNNDTSHHSVAVVNDSTTPATVSGNLITGLTSGQIDHAPSTTDTVSNNTLTSTQPAIALKVLNGGNLLASGSAAANTLSLSTSGAGYSNLSATGYPGLSLDLAASANGAGGQTSTFMLTQTGLSTATPFASVFDSNSGLLGAQITWSVYANADNALYGMDTLLGTRTFTDYGYLVSGSSSFALPSSFGTSPYSMTALVTVTPGSSGPAPVPEPGSFGPACGRYRRCRTDAPACALAGTSRACDAGRVTGRKAAATRRGPPPGTLRRRRNATWNRSATCRTPRSSAGSPRLPRRCRGPSCHPGACSSGGHLRRVSVPRGTRAR